LAVDQFRILVELEDIFKFVEENPDLIVQMPEASFDLSTKTFKFGDLEKQLDGEGYDYLIRPTSSLFFCQDSETYSIEMSVFLLSVGSFRSFTIDCKWNSEGPVGTLVVAASKVIHKMGRELKNIYLTVNENLQINGIRLTGGTQIDNLRPDQF
jgi:hypothetical protein